MLQFSFLAITRSF